MAGMEAIERGDTWPRVGTAYNATYRHPDDDSVEELGQYAVRLSFCLDSRPSLTCYSAFLVRPQPVQVGCRTTARSRGAESLR